MGTVPRSPCRGLFCIWHWYGVVAVCITQDLAPYVRTAPYVRRPRTYVAEDPGMPVFTNHHNRARLRDEPSGGRWRK